MAARQGFFNKGVYKGLWDSLGEGKYSVWQCAIYLGYAPLLDISLDLISMQSDVGITLQELYNQLLFNTIGKTMKWQA